MLEYNFELSISLGDLFEYPEFIAYHTNAPADETEVKYIRQVIDGVPSRTQLSALIEDSKELMEGLRLEMIESVKKAEKEAEHPRIY